MRQSIGLKVLPAIVLLAAAPVAAWAAPQIRNVPAGGEWMTVATEPGREPPFGDAALRRLIGDLQCDRSQTSGQLYAAENEVGRLLKTFPNDALSWAAEAEVEMRSVEIDCGCGSNPMLAVENADKAVALSPDSPLPHLSAAKAHLTIDDFAGAREEINAAIKAGATKADIATLEALAARRRGDDEANIKWLIPVVGEIDQSALQALAYTSLGDSYRNLGKMSDAEKMYRQGAALQSCVSAPQSSLAAFLLFDKADVDGAQAVLRELMQRLPDSAVQRQLSVSDYYRWAGGKESKSQAQSRDLAQSAYASPDEVFVEAARYSSGNPLLHKLLSAKVLQNVDARDAGDNSALINAGFGNNLQGAMFLLANKADVNAQNRQGQRALGFFAGAGNAEAVKFLLGYGAEVKYVDRNGESPLSNAVRGGHVEVVKLLLRPTRGRMKAGYGPADVSEQLALAAQQGRRDMILLLIAAHGDVNAQSETRMPPLIAAILNRDAQTVRLLLDNKADPAVRFRGRSAADYARSTGDAALLNLVARTAT